MYGVPAALDAGIVAVFVLFLGIAGYGRRGSPFFAGFGEDGRTWGFWDVVDFL